MSNNVADAGLLGRVTGWVVSLTILAGSSPLQAQTSPAPYTPDQCHRARAYIDGIFTRYKGTLSQELVDDLKEFSRRNCDRSIKIRMMSGTRDGDAVSELKVILAARN